MLTMKAWPMPQKQCERPEFFCIKATYSSMWSSHLFISLFSQTLIAARQIASVIQAARLAAEVIGAAGPRHTFRFNESFRAAYHSQRVHLYLQAVA
eukprot:scaffold31508_cov35-Prasinocladus_malaysianus.AAC.1